MVQRNLTLLLPLVLGTALAVGSPGYPQSRIPSFENEHDRQVARFGEVLRILGEEYVDEGKADYDTLTRAAIEGMLESLDPYSQYLTEEKFTQLQEQTRQEFGGIGIRIERRDDRITVVSPIANTPGERAGILSGDQIVSVDGTETSGYSTRRLSELLRGNPGSEVSITLYRPMKDETIEVNVVREIIKLESVSDGRIMEEGIGYVRINRFGQRTGAEFKETLDRLEAEGMTGLVIDLRNNPGGLLSAAVDVAGRFFDRGEVVVYTQGRDRESRNEIKARTSGRNKTYPLAVLINSGSASAAEIVAGALKDSRRAIIVGETSFGKGSVQRIEALRDGAALRYTSARYYTPGGVTLHEKGVEPDIEITVPTEDAGLLLRQRNRAHLAPGEFAELYGLEPIDDIQLQAAINSLKELFLRAEIEDSAPDS